MSAVAASRGWFVRLFVAALALLALGAALWQLEAPRRALAVETTQVDGMPVTLYRPAGGSADAPVVLIAHGFAGSQTLMQPFALTLASNGFLAVTFDFPGHGLNATPMRGGLADQQASHRMLMASMVRMGAYARTLGAAGADYAVLGHSMASDIVVRHGQAEARVRAVVAVSLFAPSIVPGIGPASPHNLLIVNGALEPEVLVREARRVVGVAHPGVDLREGVTVGRFADGTARRFELSPKVEHVGVLFSPHTQRAALDWLSQAFARPVPAMPFVDARGGSLALLFAGLLALGWALALLLPRAGVPTTGTAPLPWRSLAGRLLLPAVLAPLALWKVPHDLLPVLLADYLALHFGLFGILLWLATRDVGAVAAPRTPVLWVTALVVAAFMLMLLALPVDRYVFTLRPDASRLGTLAAVATGAMAYCLAHERLARSPVARRGTGVAARAAYLLSLMIAIALDPGRLFFLAIVVPVILLLFGLVGFLARASWRATGAWEPGALASAATFALFCTATFPLVR
jgi:hypothetical protein